MGKDAPVSWFGSMFLGSNPTLNANINKVGQIADFSTGLGMKNISQGSKFFSDIASGDIGKSTEALAPEISAAQGQAEQQKKQLSEFGTRSGGTAAAVANMGAKTRGDVINLLGGMKAGAAQNLESLGSGLLSSGTADLSTQTDMSQMRMQNWANSIFGGSLRGAAKLGLAVAGKQFGLPDLFKSSTPST